MIKRISILILLIILSLTLISAQDYTGYSKYTRSIEKQVCKPGIPCRVVMYEAPSNPYEKPIAYVKNYPYQKNYKYYNYYEDYYSYNDYYNKYYNYKPTQAQEFLIYVLPDEPKPYDEYNTYNQYNKHDNNDYTQGDGFRLLKELSSPGLSQVKKDQENFNENKKQQKFQVNPVYPFKGNQAYSFKGNTVQQFKGD